MGKNPVMFFKKKKAYTYLTLLCFTGQMTSSVAAPIIASTVLAVDEQQQYIVYPPVQGEALEAIAERFSLPVSALTALREQFRAYGWSSASVLVPYSSVGEARLYNNYVIYELKKGESLAAVAGRFNRSARELTSLNRQIMLASQVDSLKAGDMILVPGPVASGKKGDISVRSTKDENKLADNVVQEVVGAAQILGGNNRKGTDPTGMAVQRVAGGLTGGVSREIERFLGTNGTAKVGIQASVKGGPVGYSLDYLQPLYEREDDLIFAQVGARTFGERDLANMGIGYRNQVNDSLVLGVNGFIDQDMSRNHTRGGIGGEVWTDQARLSANYYAPFSGWKTSDDVRLNSDPESRILQERAAKGWDANVEAGFPGVKELALTAKYFQWRGDRVDVSGGRSQTEKDPKGYTLGVKYQPIPLVDLSAQHTKASGGASGWELGLGFTWDFDKSLGELLDPRKAIALRPLSQAKTDIVNRNYNIVLEYQEKEKFAPLTFVLNNLNMMVGTTNTGQRAQGGRNGMVQYTSSDPSTLAVDPSTGLLTAIAIGVVTITAFEQDAAGKLTGAASYTVNVTANTSAPTVEVTDIVGNLSVGATLTGVYTFESNGGDATDKSTMAWLNGGHDDADTQYVLDSNDVGKKLTFEVTAKNGEGIVGNTSSMDTLSVIGTQAPVVNIQDSSGNALSGPPIVGEEVKAVVVCETRDSCSGTSFSYQWQVESSPGSGTYVDIAGATSQTYTPQSHQQLKRFRVVVETI